MFLEIRTRVLRDPNSALTRGEPTGSRRRYLLTLLQDIRGAVLRQTLVEELNRLLILLLLEVRVPDSSQHPVEEERRSHELHRMNIWASASNKNMQMTKKRKWVLTSWIGKQCTFALTTQGQLWSKIEWNGICMEILTDLAICL